MAIKDLKAVLLETLLSPDSSPEEKQAAADGIAKLETAAKPAQKSPIEDTSTSDRYFREADAQIKEHLAKEALHPEPIEVLIKSGHKLWAAASDYVRQHNTTAQGEGDRGLETCSVIKGWMNSPDQAPESVRETIGYLKVAKRFLLSVGIDWPVGGIDSPFGEFPWGSDEKSWYAAEAGQGEL